MQEGNLCSGAFILGISPSSCLWGSDVTYRDLEIKTGRLPPYGGIQRCLITLLESDYGKRVTPINDVGMPQRA